MIGTRLSLRDIPPTGCDGVFFKLDPRLALGCSCYSELLLRASILVSVQGLYRMYGGSINYVFVDLAGTRLVSIC